MKMNLIRKVVLLTICIALCVAFSACTDQTSTLPEGQPSDQTPSSQEQEQTSPWGGLTYTGSGVGYVIKFENGVKFYDSGDTNLFYDMKAVINDYYKPDVAILPIGDYFTMDDKLAVRATEWVNPKVVIPNHYASYPMLNDSPDRFIDLVKESKNKGLTRAEVNALEPGKETDILGVKTMWFGHATVRMTSPTGTNVFIDPWFETNPACPAEYKKVENIGKPDVILFTHGHVDHVNMDEIEKIAKQYNPVIIAQWELGLYLQQRLSCPVILANKGGTITKDNIAKQGSIEEGRQVLPDGLEISMVSADHTSSK